VHHEWVYNAADIDAAKVAWAREVPGQDLKPLLDYYHDRKIWLVNADAAHPQLEPYRSDATAQSSH
jgi:ketosteroid isomerase-like protein